MALNGKRALITGSSRGIGRGIALRLAEEGARIAIHYYQNEAAAQDTLANVRERGADGFIVQADVLRGEELGRMYERVQAELGGLDIFVSNARPELPALELTRFSGQI
jgi:NAD(P)-dependent dehydrogenase (short-subunit alcohol dehydrogenase family)